MKRKLINMIINEFEENGVREGKSIYADNIYSQRWNELKNKLPTNLRDEFMELDDLNTNCKMLRFEDFVDFFLEFCKSILSF